MSSVRCAWVIGLPRVLPDLTQMLQPEIGEKNTNIEWWRIDSSENSCCVNYWIHPMKIKQSFSITAGFMCLAALPAFALDGVSVTFGNDDETDLVRAGLQWEWKKTWFASSSWRLGGYWDLSLGYWQMHGSAGNNPDIIDLSVTPVFRLRRNVETGFAPYVEGAIGVHLLSHTYDGKLGSSFQFGDHAGIGARFGSRQQYDLAYLFQHISNGGIKEPNHGINFNQIRFAYFF